METTFKEEKYVTQAIVNLLKKLSNAYGPPGYEEEVRQIIISEMKKISDEVYVDNLGNVIAEHKGKEPKIMIAAHMDEVALLITHIDKNGFLRFHTLGGIDPRVLYSQEIMIKTEEGNIYGYIGAKPPHLLKPEELKKAPSIEQLFIDVGASSKEEVEKLGISIGSIAVFSPRFKELGNNKVMGKAFDDRAGCTALIEIMKNIKNMSCTVYAVATVQEEVGLRGARTAAWQIEPDIGIAIEGTTASDTPGTPEHLTSTKMGQGPAITIADRSVITHPKILRKLVETAKEINIPFQFKRTVTGGTDAGVIHLTKKGVPSGVVSIPCRYIHSPLSILNINDLENTIKLITAFMQKEGR